MDIENKFRFEVYPTEKVYSEIIEWWGERDFPILPLSFLPKECLITHTDKYWTHAIFLFKTDSEICWTAFPVASPFVDKGDNEGGLEALFKFASEYAKSEGFKYVFTTSPLPKVQKSLLNEGYILGDKDVNHYLKIL